MQFDTCRFNTSKFHFDAFCGAEENRSSATKEDISKILFAVSFEIRAILAFARLLYHQTILAIIPRDARFNISSSLRVLINRVLPYREPAVLSTRVITDVNDCCINRQRCGHERQRTNERTDEDGSTRAELVSRRCTLIRLLCTVIGYDIRPFTRLAEQMEANRGRRSCTEFSLVLEHQLAARRQVSRSQINVVSAVPFVRVSYDSR